jgi:hypothetical protein
MPAGGRSFTVAVSLKDAAAAALLMLTGMLNSLRGVPARDSRAVPGYVEAIDTIPEPLTM